MQAKEKEKKNKKKSKCSLNSGIQVALKPRGRRVKVGLDLCFLSN